MRSTKSMTRTLSGRPSEWRGARPLKTRGSARKSSRIAIADVVAVTLDVVVAYVVRSDAHGAARGSGIHPIWSASWRAGRGAGLNGADEGRGETSLVGPRSQIDREAAQCDREA